MRIVEAGSLDEPDIGSEIIVPLIWRDSGQAGETARGTIVHVRQWVGRTVLVVGNGSSRQELEMPSGTEVHLP